MKELAHFLRWMSAPMLFVGVMSAVLIYVAALSTAEVVADARLESVARVVAADLKREPMAALAGKRNPVLERLVRELGERDQRLALLDAQRGVLAGDEELLQALTRTAFRALERDADQGAVGDSVAVDDRVMRVMQLWTMLPDEPVLIVVAQDKADYMPVVRAVIASEAVPLATVLALASGLALYGINVMQRPVSFLRRELEQRDAMRLEPIDLRGVPDEMMPLLSSINSLMQRLSATMVSQRRFVADAAHQLRNPLAALQVQVDLLRDLPAGTASDQAHERLQTSVQRLVRLANQLLSLARAESAAIAGERKLLAMPELAKEVALEVSEQAWERGIDVSFESGSGEPPWTLMGDATLLQELLRNLLDNAFKHTPRGGAVRLTCDPRARRLQVDDSGPGVASDKTEAIFDPFVRASSQASGTGLGLAVVREVARWHEAQVWVETSDLGGARFVVDFSDSGNRKLAES